MSIFTKFPKKFWVANTLELFERLAWYGMFMLLALYLTGSRAEGALGFTQAQKGSMMGIIVGTLYLMPVFTGAIADRFGFKRVLFVSFSIMALGYSLMGVFTSYTGMFIAFSITAAGAGLFKPIVSATVAKTTNDKTSSIGFGIFYMMVNIGAFIGPIVGAKLRIISWQNVFFFSAGLMFLNAVISFLFFEKDENDGQKSISVKKEVKQAVRNIGVALSDRKFVVFLLVIVGFWTMYNQLFYTLPVYIQDWMDTSIVYEKLYGFWPWLAERLATPGKTIAPEMMTNLDAMYIIFFQLLVSWIVMKWRPVNAMMTGFLVSAIGLGLTFMQSNPMYLFLTIFVFGIGEMGSSPKITEYIGKIAPKDKVALYMGCSFLPMAGGNYLAGWLSGGVYGSMSDKAELLTRELTARGVSVAPLSETFTKTDLYAMGQEVLKMDSKQMTHYLWDTYHPSDIWMVFTGIGVVCFLLLFLYDRMLKRSK